jgi:adsorption protein B
VVLSRVAAELALFAGVGFLLFAINDLLVDLIYFARVVWRSLAVYTRFPRAFASDLPPSPEPSFIAMFVPAWDEASVIASMLRATISRLEYGNYRIFVGHYRNDPATAAAIAAVRDPRIEGVEVDSDGPTRACRRRQSCCTMPKMSSIPWSSGFSTGSSIGAR